MKTIELAKSKLTVVELIELAEKETLILKKPDGTEFVLSASLAQCERIALDTTEGEQKLSYMESRREHLWHLLQIGMGSTSVPKTAVDLSKGAADVVATREHIFCRLATGHLLQLFGVPSPLHRDLGGRIIDVMQIVGREFD